MTKPIESMKLDGNALHDMIRELNEVLFDVYSSAARGVELPPQEAVDDLLDRSYCMMDLLERNGGYVYVLVADVPGKKLVKIGCSKKVDERVTQLGIQIPFAVRVGLIITTEAMFEMEAAMHAAFKDYRQKGEWFEVPSIREVILAVRENGHTFFIDEALIAG